MEIREDYEKEKMAIHRKNLNNFTHKLNEKKYNKEIIKVSDEHLDELQLEFIHNTDLNFDEIRMVKKVFDFLKSKR